MNFVQHEKLNQKDIAAEISLLAKVNEKVQKTLQKVTEYDQRRLQLDNLEHVKKLEEKKVSAKELKELIDWCKAEGSVSYRFHDSYRRARRVLLGDTEGRKHFMEELELVEVVREDWEEQLVPFVTETLMIVYSYSKEYRMKNLMLMYMVDESISRPPEEESRTKYALLQIGLSYCGGMIELANCVDLWKWDEIEDVIFRARNRLEKERAICEEMQRYLWLSEEEVAKEEENITRLLNVEYSKEELAAEDALFELYYNQILEPVFFDMYNHAGGKYLGYPREEFDIEKTLEKLKVTDELDPEVVRFIITDARRANDKAEFEYAPFWFWGSERYLEIINRLKKRACS